MPKCGAVGRVCPAQGLHFLSDEAQRLELLNEGILRRGKLGPGRKLAMQDVRVAGGSGTHDAVRAQPLPYPVGEWRSVQSALMRTHHPYFIFFVSRDPYLAVLQQLENVFTLMTDLFEQGLGRVRQSTPNTLAIGAERHSAADGIERGGAAADQPIRLPSQFHLDVVTDFLQRSV